MTQGLISRVIKKILPGQPGAKRWQRRYGDQLLCVRYREDASGQRRFTTVELLVDERPVEARAAPRDDEVRGVRVAVSETGIQRQIKAAGGYWDRAAGLWRLPYGHIRALRLEDRVAEHA